MQLLNIRRATAWRLILLFLALLIIVHCGLKKKPLSPGAQKFKQEIQSLIGVLAPSLIEPIQKRDIPAIHTSLAKHLETHDSICITCSFRVGVLDRQGIVLATYPKIGLAGINFSTYQTVTEALQRGRIGSQPIFTPQGEADFIICAPVNRGSKIIGALALAVRSIDLENKWGISKKEFPSIDFNIGSGLASSWSE
ncbi:hypothetical protein [Desulfobacca acetoxidans]